jgi:hypothetical protein
MRPGVGASKPSPMASSTSTAKLIQRICSGRSGVPSAMVKIPAPTNVRMKPASMIIWTRMYFIRLS